MKASDFQKVANSIIETFNGEVEEIMELFNEEIQDKYFSPYEDNHNKAKRLLNMNVISFTFSQNFIRWDDVLQGFLQRLKNDGWKVLSVDMPRFYFERLKDLDLLGLTKEVTSPTSCNTHEFTVTLEIPKSNLNNMSNEIPFHKKQFEYLHHITFPKILENTDAKGKHWVVMGIWEQFSILKTSEGFELLSTFNFCTQYHGHFTSLQKAYYHATSLNNESVKRFLCSPKDTSLLEEEFDRLGLDYNEEIPEDMFWEVFGSE